MNLPDDGHATLQTLWSGPRAGSMRHIEKQRSFYVDGNGRVIKVVASSGQFRTKKFLERASRSVEISEIELRIIIWRQP